MRITAVSYNVRGFRAGVGAVAGVVERLEPDVLLLQETGPRRALRRFADVLGMPCAADPIGWGRRRAKDAVLVREPLRLTSHRQVRFAGSATLYPRAALLAEVVGPRQRFWAISTHLGLGGAERGRQGRALSELAGGLDGPVLIGGDLNMTADARAMGPLLASFVDVGAEAGPTFPGSVPPARIDFLLVTRELIVHRCWVASSAASDHAPVAAVLGLPG
jgi:endonuclease/exonuclease/phosphatase family metal-dependent hydrolase